MSLLQNKYVVLILGSIVAAFVAWYILLRDPAPEQLLTTEDLTTATEADKDVVETLLQLRAITLSGTIFSDPAFVALKDNGTQIVPEPVGRPNPFLPLPGMGATAAPRGSSATSTSTSTAPRAGR